jgi:hypothetical protein
VDNTTCGPGDFPCVTVIDQIDGDAVGTPKGVITSWSVRAGAGTLALRVLRSRPNEFEADELHATNINESPDEAGSNLDDIRTYDWHQPVKDGDYIGITMANIGDSVGEHDGLADDQVFSLDGDLGIFANPVDNMTPETNVEPMISANVEPDADNDNYGDETEDGCPSSAATHGACPVFKPPPPPPPPPASTAATQKVTVGSRTSTVKGGKATFTLTNANDVAVKGKLKLKFGKKKVATGSYKLGAFRIGTYKVRLPRAVLRRIAKRGKVKLSLGLTAKGKTGKTFKTTAKLTVKRKAKKKRKAKRKKGDPGSLLDGKYEASPDSPTNMHFTVTNGGRRIEHFQGTVSAFCYHYSSYLGRYVGELETTPAGIESLAVAADGSFSGQQRLSDITTTVTNGKLADGVATGNLQVETGGCTRDTKAFKAVRTGG